MKYLSLLVAFIISYAGFGQSTVDISNYYDKAKSESVAITRNLTLTRSQYDSVLLYTTLYYYQLAVDRRVGQVKDGQVERLDDIRESWIASLNRILPAGYLVCYFKEKELRRKTLDSVRASRKAKQLLEN